MPIDKYLEKIQGARSFHKFVNPVPYEFIENPENYVILEGRSHKTFSYPNLLVSMERSHYNLTWLETLKILHQEDSVMLNLRQYIDFLNILKSGTAYDANGDRIFEEKVVEILNNIYAVRDPWRAEWLNNKFTIRGETTTIDYYKFNSDDQPIIMPDKLDQDTLMEDKQIDLDEWLSDANTQGLPRKDIARGNVYFWYLREGGATWFNANSGAIDLILHGSPSFLATWLGVRPAKLIK